MRSIAKALAAAGVIVVGSIQPGADAARAPYSVETEQPNAAWLSSAMFSPYADGLAGTFQQRDTALTLLPNLFELQPAVAMFSPTPVEPVSLPKYPAIERLDEVAPAPEQVKPEAEVALPAQPVAPPATDVPAPKPPVASIPAPSPREAIVIPQAPAPLAQPKDVAPSRRAARAAPPRTDFIVFDGVAGAPFAHTRFCLKYPGECRVQKQKLKFRGGPIELTAARRLELVRINTDVNRSIVGTRMNEQVAQEQWVISPQLGDCNDYAVTKRHKLIASGWPARALLLAEVIVDSGEHHLILVVRTSQGDLVLDNLNANLRNWTKTPYEWVRIESPVNPLFWSKLKSQPRVVAMNGAGRRL